MADPGGILDGVGEAAAHAPLPVNKRVEAFNLLERLLNNILENPSKAERRTIKKSNKTLQSKLFIDEAFEHLVVSCGFFPTEEVGVYTCDLSVAIEDLTTCRDLVVGLRESLVCLAEEENENLQNDKEVLLPGHVTKANNEEATEAAKIANGKSTPSNEANGKSQNGRGDGDGSTAADDFPSSGSDGDPNGSSPNSKVKRSAFDFRRRNDEEAKRKELEEAAEEARRVRAEAFRKGERCGKPRGGGGAAGEGGECARPKNDEGVGSYWSRLFGGSSSSSSSNRRGGNRKICTLDDVRPPPPRGG